MNQIVKSSPGRPRSAHANQAILQATLDLLADFGYQGMSMEAIALKAGVGKATIYRRYASKEELVADAIESIREEAPIPDTGSLSGDLAVIREFASKATLSPLGRQTIALIISTASSSPQFAQLYWKKYMVPRRQAFSTALERAKARGEVKSDLDVELFHDMVVGLLYHTLIFKPEIESLETYMRRATDLLLETVKL